MSLRLRLTLWYVLLLLATLSLFSAAVYLALARILHGQLDLALQTEARDQIIEALDARPDEPPPGLIVAVFDRQGRMLHLNQTGAPYLPPPADQFVTATRGNVRYRYCTLVLPNEKGYVQVFCSEEPLDFSLERLLQLLGLGVPSVALLAGAGGLFLASRALRPIDRMIKTAAALGADDLSLRLEQPVRDDELGRLATTFNAMLERLESAFARQRQFTADAAHELRTPLALMLSRSQITLERQRSPEEYRQAVSEIVAETERLSLLVAKLLTLARADGGTLGLELEPLDLLILSQDVVEALRPAAERIALSVTGSSTILKGDQTRLTELLVNLLENAIAATPAGGRVQIVVGERGLTIKDSGCGIAGEHLERIFERFYQTDPSRGSRVSCGLGLAICRAIVAEHGGTLAVTSQPGLGSEFRVQFT